MATLWLASCMVGWMGLFLFCINCSENRSFLWEKEILLLGGKDIYVHLLPPSRYAVGLFQIASFPRGLTALLCPYLYSTFFRDIFDGVVCRSGDSLRFCLSTNIFEFLLCAHSVLLCQASFPSSWPRRDDLFCLSKLSHPISCQFFCDGLTFHGTSNGGEEEKNMAQIKCQIKQGSTNFNCTLGSYKVYCPEPRQR